MGAAAVVGLICAVLSFIGVLYCTISYEWKQSSPLASQQSLQYIYNAEGLWLRCSIPAPGLLQCDNYSTTLFNVESYIQILRALTILSALSLFTSCVLDIMALDCINCIRPRTQLWSARIGGICAFIGGALCLAAVSWYATDVIRDFKYDFSNQSIKYTFGSALYVGWIAGGLALLSGGLSACFSFCSGSDDDVMSYPAYKAPKSRTNEEYV